MGWENDIGEEAEVLGPLGLQQGEALVAKPLINPK
jgi:hypothetical protein